MLSLMAAGSYHAGPISSIQSAAMKPAPPDWPRISSSLYYDDPKKAIEWLCKAFGFEVRILVEAKDGSVAHSELTFGDGLIMVAGSQKNERMMHTRTPKEAGGNTQNLFMYVDDVEAHCKRAREAGATITTEPMTQDYGEDYWSDRTYGCTDIGGHHWWIGQRLRNPKPGAKPAKHVKE
jgi:uncharacterized glyoxalase superfamily protein PhnB